MGTKTGLIRRPSRNDHLLVVVLGLGLALVSQSLITTINVHPAAGLILAAFLVFGPSVWPSVLVGSLLGAVADSFQTGISLTSSAGATVALSAVVGALAAGWVGGRIAGPVETLGSAFASLRWILIRYLPAVVLFAFVSALSVVGGYWLAGKPWTGGFWEGVVGWTVADIVGALVAGPLLLSLWLGGVPRRTWGAWVRILLSALGLVLLGLGLFGPGEVLIPAPLRQSSLLLLPLMYVALTRGPTFTHFFLVLAFVLAWVGTNAGFGPFLSIDVAGTNAALQSFMVIAALVVLSTQAVLLELRRSMDEGLEDLRQMKLRLEHRVEARTRELSETNRKFDDLTLTDSLTRIANGRAFGLQLHREQLRHTRSGRTLSLILVDLDGFRGFNEFHGAVQGDECLRQIARILSEAAGRPSDLVARQAADRFVCLLPETLPEGALVIARRILEASRSLGQVTLSLGVVSGSAVRGDTLETLMNPAEALVLRAKAEGGDRLIAEVLPERQPKAVQTAS